MGAFVEPCSDFFFFSVIFRANQTPVIFFILQTNWSEPASKRQFRAQRAGPMKASLSLMCRALGNSSSCPNFRPATHLRALIGQKIPLEDEMVVAAGVNFLGIGPSATADQF